MRTGDYPTLETAFRANGGEERPDCLLLPIKPAIPCGFIALCGGVGYYPSELSSILDFSCFPVQLPSHAGSGSQRPASRLPGSQGILCSRQGSGRRLQRCCCSFQVWIAGLAVRRNCLKLCALSWSRMHGACGLEIRGAEPCFHHGVLKSVMCDSTDHSGRISSCRLGAEDPSCGGHDVFCCHRGRRSPGALLQGWLGHPEIGQEVIAAVAGCRRSCMSTIAQRMETPGLELRASMVNRRFFGIWWRWVVLGHNEKRPGWNLRQGLSLEPDTSLI